MKKTIADQFRLVYRLMEKAKSDPAKQRLFDQQLLYGMIKTDGGSDEDAARIVAELVIEQNQEANLDKPSPEL